MRSCVWTLSNEVCELVGGVSFVLSRVLAEHGAGEAALTQTKFYTTCRKNTSGIYVVQVSSSIACKVFER